MHELDNIAAVTCAPQSGDTIMTTALLTALILVMCSMQLQLQGKMQGHVASYRLKPQDKEVHSLAVLECQPVRCTVPCRLPGKSRHLQGASNTTKIHIIVFHALHQDNNTPL